MLQTPHLTLFNGLKFFIPGHTWRVEVPVIALSSRILISQQQSFSLMSNSMKSTLMSDLLSLIKTSCSVDIGALAQLLCSCSRCLSVLLAI